MYIKVHIVGIKKKRAEKVAPEDYLLITAIINGLSRRRRHLRRCCVESFKISRVGRVILDARTGLS